MASFTIYHNPRCSKSRQTLQILNDNGVEVEILEYLKTPPSKAQLKKVLKALGMKPQDIMRKKEAEYKESGLDNQDLNIDSQLDLMIAYPKVIERPIVIKDDKAVIGRPPENVLELIK
ncbi:arsenate reductase (glutaredoxin) [Aliikangiella coralliicola]|uniref:Arsenate reductase n=1 Tax=Aliikangiella coralliicola TaxID=2592383 RepID=A0A545U502_9GAMM|nr:arsenate reductase (glutaredoxin) [Aliikangiella coralliicola]TQV84548.1 arsenate reductase (glutaredoxin) [Aliikangiella coralliicola]